MMLPHITVFPLLRVVVFAGVILLAAYPRPAVGQTSLRGRVLDPNHAAIVAAQVTAIKQGRLKNATAVTNGTGEFSLTLEPDEYTLHITAPGFEETTQTVRPKSGVFEALEIVLQVV